jgi:SAM-dependent methyltransferase
MPDASAVRTAHDAYLELRADPATTALIHESYLDADTSAAARRFERSAELAAVRALLGDVSGLTVLDLGAGNGIASVAFAKVGAAHVFALEPDASDTIGRAAIARVSAGLAVETLDACGEAIPLADGTVDLVYARQVLHHADDLERLVAECARVLRPGGTMLASREHVVDDDAQLREFLDAHPVHRLTGGEHAYSLPRYVSAFERAGLQIQKTLGPWDSVINAYPTVSSDEELAEFGRTIAAARLGRLGAAAVRVPLVEALVWRRLRRPRAGRLYTFLATLPR